MYVSHSTHLYHRHLTLFAEEKLHAADMGAGNSGSSAGAVVEIDVALRHLLTHFRLPGEAQKIDHVMQAFARRYCLGRAASAAGGSAASTPLSTDAVYMYVRAILSDHFLESFFFRFTKCEKLFA